MRHVPVDPGAVVGVEVLEGPENKRGLVEHLAVVGVAAALGESLREGGVVRFVII